KASGTTTFDGAVGTTVLSSLATDAGGSTQINGGSVATTGNQTYNDAVSLGAATTLTTSANCDVTFGSTINAQSNSLSVSVGPTTGNVTFNGAVTNGSTVSVT